MENLINFVKPELLVLIPALYFLGAMLKSSQLPDKWIPATLGVCGIALAVLYVAATSPLTSPQDVSMAAFVGVTQGILAAGMSVYCNQFILVTD